MKVMVTGANGFMGGAFMRALQAGPHSYLGLVRSNPAEQMIAVNYSVSSLHEAFKSFQPDIVVHAAGTASVALSLSDPQKDRAGSISLVENLISAAKSMAKEGFKPPRFLYVSTAAVYGNPKRMPVREDDELAPISPYGVNRLACEKQFLDYGVQNNVSILIARAFSVFGARQRRLVLWEIANQAIRHEKVVIHGTGREMRDFISITEFVDRCLKLAEAPLQGNAVVNVASGQSHTIEQLVKTILDILGRDIPLDAKNQAQPGNPDFWEASIAKYRGLTGDLSTPNFRDDLRECLSVWKTESN